GVGIYDGANGNTVGGASVGARNVVSGNTGHGVDIAFGSGSNTVQGNFIGTNAAGTAPIGNAGAGVLVNFTSIGNQIGGTAAGAGNTIGGNLTGGIAIGNGSANNRVEGNFVGTNASGATGLGNTGSGIKTDNAANNRIGDANVPNVIGFNTRHGIELTGTGSTGNLVQNNFTGVTPSTFAGGSRAIPNALAGIALLNGAGSNDIGGTSRGNIVAGNTGDGVLIDSANGNTVRGNRIGIVGLTTGIFPNGGAGVHVISSDARIGSISGSELNLILNNAGAGIRVDGASTVTARGNILQANGGLGIDLGGDGVTANDALDADSGPNTLLNFPTLTSATLVFGSTYTVSGDYDGAPNATFTIDLYANAVADPTGFGEALSRLTSFTVTTDNAGRATFTQNVNLPASGPFGGPIAPIFTAHATSGNGTTGPSSEFSNALSLVATTASLSVSDAAVAEGQSGDSVITFRVRLSAGVAGPVTVQFATNALAAPGAATAGSDYDAQQGSLTFAAGETEHTIAITVHGDLTPEARERFGLTLSNATGAVLADAVAVGTILDDDHHLFFAAQNLGSRVEIRNASGGELVRTFSAFNPAFKGGVRIASGDVNGDGFNDVITATGDGGGARVRVYDGHNVTAGRPAVLYDFFAFGNGYRGGLNVAAGDVNGDGKADIIVAPSAGSSGLVKVFSGANGSLHTSFLAFGRGTGGVRVAAGDINGDGYSDIIAGTGAGSSVRVFDGRNPATILKDFRAFPITHRGGVTVAAGDVDGDGLDDVIVGAGRESNIARIFLSKATGGVLQFNAFGGTGRGINVGAVDVNSDGIADIIAAQSRNAAPRIRIFDGASILNGTPTVP
ncbi:MAG: FG-GAP-like repeat-containing protein, partial [Chthoniobacteraceae bacterium]